MSALPPVHFRPVQVPISLPVRLYTWGCKSSTTVVPSITHPLQELESGKIHRIQAPQPIFFAAVLIPIIPRSFGDDGGRRHTYCKGTRSFIFSRLQPLRWQISQVWYAARWYLMFPKLTAVHWLRRKVNMIYHSLL